MAKQKNDKARIGRFVLGNDSFAKISEVEGIRLTADMKKRASEAKAKRLTPEEYRHANIRSHRKG